VVTDGVGREDVSVMPNLVGPTAARVLAHMDRGPATTNVLLTRAWVDDAPRMERVLALHLSIAAA